jgi:hypothetical protein
MLFNETMRKEPEAIAKLPLPGKSMVLTPIARADLSARSVPTMTFSSEKASRNGCNGRQKGGFPAAGSFAIASHNEELWQRLKHKIIQQK